MTTYSAEYLQGIKDGRAALKDGGDVIALASADLGFCDRVSGLMGSALGADYIKGLRDFWKNQLKKEPAR